MPHCVPMSSPPTRTEALELLRSHWAEIAAFGVQHLDLVGSVARNSAKNDSDVDCVAEFAGRVTFRQCMGLVAYLHALFGRKVDVMTPESAHPLLRATFAAEAVRVA